MIIHHVEMVSIVILRCTGSRIVGWIDVDPAIEYMGGRIGCINIKDTSGWEKYTPFGRLGASSSTCLFAQ